MDPSTATAQNTDCKMAAKFLLADTCRWCPCCRFHPFLMKHPQCNRHPPNCS